MARSLAEYYRAHREAFELALELQCTPKEAEAELARRAARKRWEEAERRLSVKMNAPIYRAPDNRTGQPLPDDHYVIFPNPDRPQPRSFEERDSQPWMMRD